PVDKTQIPTGEIAPVKGTPMDFTTAKPLGQDIKEPFEQLIIGKGYDHCWAINDYKKGSLHEAAELYSPESGILLNVSTTQPGVQIYTGNWLDGTGVSKQGAEHKDYEGVAIECQNFPDSPNKSNFPSPVLKAGDKYEEHIVFSFSTK
ncbi:MAG: galactose-1-epimerase, partial [Rikenellaceae bacterium]